MPKLDYPTRGSYYSAGREGRSFAVAHQTPTTGVTGQTSFAATTPTFIIYQAAATTRSILRGFQLSQSGTVAGGDISIALAIDTANRYSAGGTAVVAKNTSSVSAATAGFTFAYNATASAAGAGTRYIGRWTVDNVLGTVFSYESQDGDMIDTTGSILVYTWASTTGPTFDFTFRLADELY